MRELSIQARGDCSVPGVAQAYGVGARKARRAYNEGADLMTHSVADHIFELGLQQMHFDRVRMAGESALAI